MKKTIKNAISSLTAKLAALLLAFGCAAGAWAGPVAQIGANQYETLAAAIAAVPENGAEATTITMIADTELGAIVEIPQNKKVVLDLNGKTITTALESSGRHYYAIKSYGTFTLEDSSSPSSGKIIARGTWNADPGKMTINGGTITACDNNGGAAVWNESDLVVEGGTFSGYVCINNQGNNTVVINGGNFVGGSSAYALQNNGGAAGGSITINNANLSGDAVHGGFYLNGGTLTINNMTMNITSTAYNAIYATGGAKVTIKDGEYRFTTTTTQQMFSLYKSYSNTTLTIDGGTFVSTNTSYPTKELVVFQNGGNGNYTLNVNGGTFTGPSSNWQLIWTHTAPLGSGDSANVNGGTFNTNPENATYNWANSGVTLSSAATIIDNGNGTWTVKRSNPATGITLSCGSVLAIPVGDTMKITAALEPADATDTIVWSSSATSHVTVDQEGNVTLLDGTGADVTATAGSVSATCRVAPLYSYIGTAQAGQYRNTNASSALNTITGENKFTNYYTYETSDSSVVSIGSNMMGYPTLTTVAAGTVRITVTSTQNINNVRVVDAVYYVDLTVTPKPSITVTPSEAEIEVGESATLVLTLSNVSGTIQWSSSGDDCIDDPVLVEENTYTVRGKASGTITLAPYISEGLKIIMGNSCDITVRHYVAQIGDDKYETLAEAILAAQSGDTIEILDGTWGADAVGSLTTQESASVRGKSLTIQAAEGAKPKFTSNVSLGYDDSKTANATMTVKGLAFENAKLSLVNYVQATVEGCSFKGSGASAALFVGDSCDKNHLTSGDYPADQVTIKDCTFDGTAAGAPAIRVRNGGNVTVTGNTVANSAHNGILLESNTSLDNSAAKTVAITENTITEWNAGNVAGGGRGIRAALGTLAEGSTVTIEDNVFRKETLGLDEPDFAKLSGTGSGTVDLSGNDWNDMLLSEVNGNGAVYTSDASAAPTITTVITTRKEPVAQIGTTKYTTLAEAILAAQSGDTIEILDGTWGADAVGTLTTSEALSVRAKSLTIQAASGASPKFTSNVTLGYDDSSTRNATMTVKGLAFENAQLLVGNYAQTTVEDCTFSNATLRVIESCSSNYNRTDFVADQVTIKDCTFDGTPSGEPAIRVRNSGNLLITGNTVANSAHNGILLESNGTVNTQVAKTVVVTDNTITEWNAGNVSGGGRGIRASLGTLAAGSTVTISENVFRKETLGFDEPDFAKITGMGSGTADISGNDWNDMLLSEVNGNSAVYTSDGAAAPTITTVITTRKEPVAQIGTTKYETLAEALSNAQDFDTVVLIADAVLPTQFIFDADKEITLDLAGHAITSTADDLLKVQSGVLTVNDSVGGGSVFTDNWTVFCVDGGDVVVNGGKFDATQHNTVFVLDGWITFNGGMVDMGVDSVGEYSGEDVKAYEGLGENVGYTIFVEPLVSDIDPPIYETTAVGVSSTVKLDAYYGAGAMLTWSSSDTSIATVDSTGLVTFTGTAGTATIYAVAQNGSYATAMVAVGTATVKNMTTGKEYVMLQTAIDAASAGDTLKLIANVSLTDAAYVPDTAEIVIDLDGHDIVNTRTGVTSAQYAIYNDGTLTIKDSKDDGTTGGHVYTTNIETSGNEAVLNYGTLVIEGGWFGDSDCDKTNANIINAGRAVTTYGTATLNGGHYTAIDNFTNGKYTYALFSNGSAASLTINAADIYGTMNGVISSSNGGLLTVNDATIVFGRMDFDTYPYRLAYGYYGNIVINGGTWKTQAKVRASDSQEFCDWYKSDAITITGGKFDLQDWTDVYGIAKISGGIFNKVVPAKNLATGCICTDNLDPETKVTYPYTVGTPVAQIGDVKYVTFADAIVAAEALDPEPAIIVLDTTAEVPDGWKFVTDSSEPPVTTLVRKVYVAQISTTKYESLADAFAAAQDGDTVQLLKDCETGTAYTHETPLVFNTANATLDLNGKTLTITYNMSLVFRCNNGVVMNGSIVPGVTDSAVSGDWCRYGLTIDSCSGVTVSNVVSTTGIAVGGDPDGGYTPGAGPATDVVFTGCTVTGRTTRYAVMAQNQSTATIKDGTYNAYAANGNVLYSGFKPNDGGAGSLTVTGGSFMGAIPDSNIGAIVISGGIFSKQPVAGLLAPGCMVVANEDAATKDAYPWTVAAAVAQIVRNDAVVAQYASLAAAFAAAQSGDMVQLLTDCETGTSYNHGNPLVFNTANTTLDLNGKTLTITYNMSLVYRCNNGVVMNGTIVPGVTDSAVSGDWCRYGLTIDSCSGVTVSNVVSTTGIAVGGDPDGGYTPGAGPATDVVFTGCTVTGRTTRYAVMAQNQSTATIKDGTYSAYAANGNVLYSGFKPNDGGAGSLTVTGGSFMGAIPDSNIGAIVISGGIFSKQPVAGLLAPGYVVVANEDAATKAAYPYTVAGAVAQIVRNDAVVAQYASLAAAFAAAQSGDMVQLLTDCETGTSYTHGNPLVFNTANTTLDLNGKTLTITYNMSLVFRCNNGVVMNGTIVPGVTDSAVSGDWCRYGLTIDSCSGVTVSNVVSTTGIAVGGDPDGGYTPGAGPATDVVFTGCTVTGRTTRYAVMAQNQSTATIKDGTYNAYAANGNVLYSGFKPNDGGAGSLTVTGGSFMGAIPDSNIGAIVISGGIFSKQPVAGLLAPGYVVVANEDAATKDAYPYTVAGAVASITVDENTTYYATFADAIAAADAAVEAGDDDPAIKVLNGATEQDNSDWKIVDGYLVRKVFKVLVFSDNGATTNKCETLAEAFDVATGKSGDASLELLDNLVMGEHAYSGKAVSINGAGKTVTFDTASLTAHSYNDFPIWIDFAAGDAPIAISNITFNGTGGNYTFGIGAGQSTISGVTINANGNEGLCIDGGSSTLEDVTIHNTGVNAKDWHNTALSLSSMADVTVNGGEYTSENGYAIYLLTTGGKFTINDGTFAGKIRAGVNNSTITAEILIKGGKFDVPEFKTDGGATAKIVISGGVFKTAPDAAFLAENYVVTDNKDPDTKDAYPYTVVEVVSTGSFVYPIEGTAGVPVTSEWLAANLSDIYGSDPTAPILASITNDLVTALSENGANNMPKWESYVLGLNPAVETAVLRLTAEPVANESTKVVVSAVINLANMPVIAGTTVSFRLAAQNGDEWTTVESATPVATLTSDGPNNNAPATAFIVPLDDVAGKVLAIFADIVTE